MDRREPLESSPAGAHMNTPDRADFLDAVREAAMLLQCAHGAVRRARSHCHPDIQEFYADVLSKRLGELQAICGWLRQQALGRGGSVDDAIAVSTTLRSS